MNEIEFMTLEAQYHDRVGGYAGKSLTILDYFAAAALPVVYPKHSTDYEVARRAYDIAEQMLREKRNRLPPPF